MFYYLVNFLMVVMFAIINIASSADFYGSNNNMVSVGYNGGSDRWGAFLKCWEDETLKLINDKTVFSELEQEIKKVGKQGYEPAGMDGIAKKEKELNVTFPKSYIDFLLTSNGWRQLQFDDNDGRVFSIEKIGFFSSVYPKEYNEAISLSVFNNEDDYSEKQDPVNFDVNDFEKSIVISESVNGGLYLINTKKTSPEGEFSIWFYSPRHPGVYKFTSFAHLMQYAYIKSIKKPEFDIPYGEKYIRGTCAEILGIPKVYTKKDIN